MLSYENSEGEKQWIPLVHVSKKLQQFFEAREVAAVEIHRLSPKRRGDEGATSAARADCDRRRDKERRPHR